MAFIPAIPLRVVHRYSFRCAMEWGNYDAETTFQNAVVPEIAAGCSNGKAAVNGEEDEAPTAQPNGAGLFENDYESKAYVQRLENSLSKLRSGPSAAAGTTFMRSHKARQALARRGEAVRDELELTAFAKELEALNAGEVSGQPRPPGGDWEETLGLCASLGTTTDKSKLLTECDVLPDAISDLTTVAWLPPELLRIHVPESSTARTGGQLPTAAVARSPPSTTDAPGERNRHVHLRMLTDDALRLGIEVNEGGGDASGVGMMPETWFGWAVRIASGWWRRFIATGRPFP